MNSSYFTKGDPRTTTMAHLGLLARLGKYHGVNQRPRAERSGYSGECRHLAQAGGRANIRNKRASQRASKLSSPQALRKVLHP